MAYHLLIHQSSLEIMCRGRNPHDSAKTRVNQSDIV
uniref:Uncharacterized protein n=1 Tax=Arundo donax TaxID=35708 RepID=A0A0A9H3J4_ARUDO